MFSAGGDTQKSEGEILKKKSSTINITDEELQELLKRIAAIASKRRKNRGK